MDNLPEFSKFFGQMWENGSHVYDIHALDGNLYQTEINSRVLAAPMPLSLCSAGFLGWLVENPTDSFRISKNFAYNEMHVC